MRSSRALRGRLWLVAALAVAGPAGASDGVIEINQAKAQAGGVTPSDTPGFPVTIGQPGSYRLTGSLDVSGEANPQNATAILISASFVTLDLNGFSLVGPTVCTGSPVSSCAPTGNGVGIHSSTSNFVTIRNGIVRGFANSGIFAGNGIIEGVSAVGNAVLGIALGAGGLVKDSTALGNGNIGISGQGVIVEASRALENGAAGMFFTPGEVRGSEAVHNGGDGMYVGAGLAQGNVSRGNLNCAIEAPGGGYSGNNVSGVATLCVGIQLGPNLCNGSICP